MGTYNCLFDVILRLSEALVCFRGSGANFCALSLLCFRVSFLSLLDLYELIIIIIISIGYSEGRVREYTHRQ